MKDDEKRQSLMVLEMGDQRKRAARTKRPNRGSDEAGIFFTKIPSPLFCSHTHNTLDFEIKTMGVHGPTLSLMALPQS